jgi:hydrogenase nickel incorporation protein HypA/HybF
VHELSLAQSIVDIAAEAAAAHGAEHLTIVEVVIGAYGGGADAALRTCFQIAAVGTPCEGAELVLDCKPATFWCWDCSSRTLVKAPLPDSCPACGSARVEVQGDRSFMVVGIEFPEEELCGSRF